MRIPHLIHSTEACLSATIPHRAALAQPAPCPVRESTQCEDKVPSAAPRRQLGSCDKSHLMCTDCLTARRPWPCAITAASKSCLSSAVGVGPRIRWARPAGGRVRGRPERPACLSGTCGAPGAWLEPTTRSRRSSRRDRAPGPLVDLVAVLERVGCQSEGSPQRERRRTRHCPRDAEAQRAAAKEGRLRRRRPPRSLRRRRPCGGSLPRARNNAVACGWGCARRRQLERDCSLSCPMPPNSSGTPTVSPRPA